MTDAAATPEQRLLELMGELQLNAKRDLLLEMLQLADAFILGSEPPYEKAWDVLNAKYNATAQCEGCGGPVAKHEDAAYGNSVRRSVKLNGTTCCSHLPPKVGT